MGERVKSNRFKPKHGPHHHALLYASKITEKWQSSVQAIIDTGKLMIEAKVDLDHHGEWLWMFKRGNVPFGERTAQMLMEIARHPVISNPKYVSYLPPSWGTLYALTKIPDPVLENMISDHTLTSEITRKKVEEIDALVKEEGHYVGINLRKALNLLLRAMDKRQPDQVVEHVIMEEEVEDPVKEPVDHERLKSLADWIERLHDACQKQMEQRGKEREELLKARKLQRQKMSARTRDERENIKEHFNELGYYTDDEEQISRAMRRRFPRDED